MPNISLDSTVASTKRPLMAKRRVAQRLTRRRVRNAVKAAALRAATCGPSTCLKCNCTPRYR
eukprot:12901645-Prorocentrum_lima.AAC.1